MYLQADLALTYFLIIALIVFIQISAMTLLLIKCLKKANAGQAIIRTGQGGTSVSFDRAIVIPYLHQYELIDISVKKLSYERTGRSALKFKCGTRVELVADLMMRINKEVEDVKRAVQFLGAKRINDTELLREFYSSIFNDSLETIAGQFEFEKFVSSKDSFREAILMHLGTDLKGMVADDLCIHHLREL